MEDRGVRRVKLSMRSIGITALALVAARCSGGGSGTSASSESGEAGQAVAVEEFESEKSEGGFAAGTSDSRE
jgi:ABC-type glycerol-3-phosphate transport system substrate-binding protein